MGARGGPAPSLRRRRGRPRCPPARAARRRSSDRGGRGAHGHDRAGVAAAGVRRRGGLGRGYRAAAGRAGRRGHPRDGTTTTFVHPLARETAATGASPARAAEAHVRDARAILDAAGSRRRRRAGEAGTHLAEALLLRWDGAAEDPDRIEAIDLLSAAAEHAAEVGDAAGAAILERRMA